MASRSMVPPQPGHSSGPSISAGSPESEKRGEEGLEQGGAERPGEMEYSISSSQCGQVNLYGLLILKNVVGVFFCQGDLNIEPVDDFVDGVWGDEG